MSRNTRIKLQGTLGTANRDGFGVVFFDEVIGSRAVATRNDLDKIPFSILFGTLNPTANELSEHLGHQWYVRDEDCYYVYKRWSGTVADPVLTWEKMSGGSSSQIGVTVDFQATTSSTPPAYGSQP